MQRRTPLIALLTLATTALLPLAAHADALDDILAKKQINIAVPTDFPPYGFVGTDLKPQGLDVDMAVYIGAKLGVKVELVPVTSANRIPYLQTKKADLVISTLGKNPERAAVIDFTAAYSPFFQAVFAAKGVAIKSAADLAGKTVAVTRNWAPSTSSCSRTRPTSSAWARARTSCAPRSTRSSPAPRPAATSTRWHRSGWAGPLASFQSEPLSR